MRPRLRSNAAHFAAALLPFLVGLAFADPAFAAPPVAPAAAVAANAHPPAAGMSIGDRARAFAAKHNLPVRTVEVNIEGRKATRVFVPVTEATHEAFINEFTDHGAVIRQRQADAEHVTMALAPQDLIHNWGRPGPMFDVGQGGLYVAMNLTDVEKAHFKATVANAQNKEFIGKNGSANCTRWLVHGCIGPDQPLSHKFGIKRSNAPSNFVKKLIHAGNEEVIIGVAMSTSPAQTQQLRTQVANYDQRIAQIEDAIAKLELQGGGRVQAFRAQSDPYRDALTQLDATIAMRQGQPAIAAALKVKQKEIGEALKTLTQQHEAPYHQRVGELDTAVIAGKAKVRQAEIAKAAAIKEATTQVHAREHDHEQLTRAAAPDHGKQGRFQRRLADFDHQIREVKAGFETAKAQRGTQRAAQRSIIAAAKTEYRALAQQGSRKAGVSATSVNALNQRVAQLDQSITNLEQGIERNAAAPGYEHQIEDWRAALGEARQEKARLLEGGPSKYNPAFTQRLAQLDNDMATTRKNLGANPAHGSVPAWLAQLKNQVAERDVILQKGPENYNPAFEQRVAQLDQTIKQYKQSIEQHENNPAQRQNVAQWRATVEQSELLLDTLQKVGPSRYEQTYDQKLTAVAQRVFQARVQIAQLDVQDSQAEAGLQANLAPKQKQRDDLAHAGADAWNPEFDAAVAQIDNQIKPLETNIATYANQPQYANHIAQWRAQLAPLQEKKAQIVAKGPHDFNQAYEQRLTQLDQAIAQADATLAQYRANPAYAAHVPNAEANRKTQVDAKEALVKIGPHAYDPAFEQKLTASATNLAKAKTNLETVTAQHATTVETAKAELGRSEGLRAEMKRHGATNFNPAWEQRITQLDQAITQAEGQVKAYAGAQYAGAQYDQHRANAQKTVDDNRALRASVLEKGPQNYNPNEPQIAQHKQQLDQLKVQAEPLRAQLAVADAAANGGDALAQKFNAIPEPALMGAPPGGGAAEAVRK